MFLALHMSQFIDRAKRSVLRFRLEMSMINILGEFVLPPHTVVRHHCLNTLIEQLG